MRLVVEYEYCMFTAPARGKLQQVSRSFKDAWEVFTTSQFI